MISSKIKSKVNDNGIIERLIVESRSNEEERNIVVKIGKEMIVKPLNVKKLKHRDRRVIINKITDEGFKGTRASVKFLDNNRLGKVDIADLDDLI
jgi:hypothetical protein